MIHHFQTFPFVPEVQEMIQECHQYLLFAGPQFHMKCQQQQYVEIHIQIESAISRSKQVVGQMENSR